jgi:GH24 family phage-related lysozyme (muramidase)
MATAALEPNLISAVSPLLISHEGERLKVYTDTEGIPTIGVGLALMQKNANGLYQSPYARALCKRCGVDYLGVISGNVDLTLDQSRHLLALCIIDVIEWLVILFPAFWTYSQPRQIALIDLGFNLGETHFRGFKEMVSCILAGNWAGAAHEALHSDAATKLPARYTYDAGLLGEG